MPINRQWILKSRPSGMVSTDNLAYRESDMPNTELNDGEVLVRNKIFACMPAMRTWMNADSEYFPPIPLGAPVTAPAVAEVVTSNNPRFKAGTLVSGLTGWEDYSLVSKNNFFISPLPEGIDPLDALTILGGNAITAYFGLLKVGEPKDGETVVVTGAAGSTGSLVCQIAKIKGCRVIGIAGGPEKCKWLLDEANIDAAIDYKSEDVAARLKELCPKGVDVFFDNVGGTIMQDVIDQMAMYGRCVMCGQIAHYNTPGPAPGPRDMFRVISHRLRIQGFISSDFMKDRKEALTDLSAWARAGKLAHQVDMREGFKNLPETYFELFSGGNNGTLLLKVDEA